ncbi:MAG: hypothetical protein LBF24_02005 [Puniceicoccales bacterium]|jgi:hypothetical protein|nr:hypothetical protein [Puniceicoccales bacterium]
MLLRVPPAQNRRPHDAPVAALLLQDDLGHEFGISKDQFPKVFRNPRRIEDLIGDRCTNSGKIFDGSNAFSY